MHPNPSLEMPRTFQGLLWYENWRSMTGFSFFWAVSLNFFWASSREAIFEAHSEGPTFVKIRNNFLLVSLVGEVLIRSPVSFKSHETGLRKQDFPYEVKEKVVQYFSFWNCITNRFTTFSNNDLHNLVKSVTLNQIAQENTQLFISAQAAEWL